MSLQRDFQVRRTAEEARVEALEAGVQQRVEVLHNQEQQLEQDMLLLRVAETDERRQLVAEAARLAQQESAVTQREIALTQAEAGLRADEVEVRRL